jgi:hypothetical protein
MKMSEWRAARNQQSLARLNRAMPADFPAAVLAHALACAFIPPTPRLAVDRYWRAHPLRADRLSRALAARGGAPEGWIWRIGGGADGVPMSFRTPPAPYREKAFARGPGHCCVCGQPVYKLGWHVDRWGKGPNKNATWHGACVIAWQFWNAPSTYVQPLRKSQGRRCAESGKRLWKTAEVDHRTPLFRVWRDLRNEPWPLLLAYWGQPNLQVINRDIHVAKCVDETQQRAQKARAQATADAAV